MYLIKVIKPLRYILSRRPDIYVGSEFFGHSPEYQDAKIAATRGNGAEVQRIARAVYAQDRR